MAGRQFASAILHGKSFVGIPPKHFFRDEGVMPESVVFAFARPRGFEHMTAADFAALVNDRIRSSKSTTAAERRETGTVVLGRKRSCARPGMIGHETASPDAL